MGKKRIEINKIPNPKQRYKAFLKRKRGLMKKAIELSMLCGVNIFLGIINPDTECTSIYQSENSSMTEIIRSLRNNNIKKEFINSSSYNSFLDPHYIKLVNRIRTEKSEIKDITKKKIFQFYSVSEPANHFLKSNSETQINNLIELESECQDLFTAMQPNIKYDPEKTSITKASYTSTDLKLKSVLDVKNETSLESLKDQFINESSILNTRLKEQMLLIEELGSFSDELLKQLLEDPQKNQLELYKLLKDYSNSLVNGL